MKYDFDEIVNRRGTNSVKWDEVKEEGVRKNYEIAKSIL